MKRLMGFIRKRGHGGFSLIEVIFAILILGIGIVGILSLFVTGINAASWSGNQTFAAMEAQSLLTEVLAEVNGANQRLYLEKIRAVDPALQTPPGARSYQTIWINPGASATPDQVPRPAGYASDLYWSCRASNAPMNKDDPLNEKGDQTTNLYPVGLYQLAIAVYRRYQPGKEPIAVYTTFVTAGF